MAQRICKIHLGPDLGSNYPALTDKRKYKQLSSRTLSSGFTNSGLLFLIKMDCHFLIMNGEKEVKDDLSVELSKIKGQRLIFKFLLKILTNFITHTV